MSKKHESVAESLARQQTEALAKTQGVRDLVAQAQAAVEPTRALGQQARDLMKQMGAGSSAIQGIADAAGPREHPALAMAKDPALSKIIADGEAARSARLGTRTQIEDIFKGERLAAEQKRKRELEALDLTRAMVESQHALLEQLSTLVEATSAQLETASAQLELQRAADVAAARDHRLNVKIALIGAFTLAFTVIAVIVGIVAL